MEQAYTTQAGAGLVAIELKNGMIAHHSPSFQDLTSWIPVEARGNIRVALKSQDGDDFHSFCQSVVRDAGELHGETYLGRDNVVGRSITVSFLTRAPGPPGLRNPEWLLMVRAVKLTLVGVQHMQLAGESPIADMTPPVLDQGRIPEAIGVFTADLSGSNPQQWTLQVAHVRYLLDLEVASGTYDMDTGNLKPLEQLATYFNFEVAKEEGAGASIFSRAAAHLEYATTSALNIAQRAASWLIRRALTSTHEWVIRLAHDDTVSVSFIALVTIFGGLSVSVKMDFLVGKVGFSHGGLDVLYFVSDPEKPLDRNLRATLIRIPAAKTRGEFDRHRPLVVSLKWGSGLFHGLCMKLPVDTVGKKMPLVEDVSQVFEKLKVSPGGGSISDGTTTICLGQSVL